MDPLKAEILLLVLLVAVFEVRHYCVMRQIRARRATLAQALERKA